MGVGPGRAGSLVGQKLGKYDVLALLAIGGTAEIYLARIVGEAGFEKYVVIKCLLDHLADDADFVRMFLDEARLGAQLDHSNIVQTLELGQHDNRYFMAMEYLAGMSLAQMARKTHEREPSGVIPVELVIGLIAQAAGGLHYAHERVAADGTQLNVVHRDVSPQNLVITFEGILKIVDFGIAKAEQRQTHTRSGTIKGKFAYMSPEQCMAEPIDRRTDIFALGTVAHELLTARRLFKRSNTYETYQAIVKGNVPPPSRYNDDVDESLDRVLLRALSYHKEDRYNTAEELGESLLSWLHGRGRSVSAGDVSRFVERVCKQEIDDHAEHMRELISGRVVTGTDLLSWDKEGEDSESESLQAQPLGAGALASSDVGNAGSDDEDGDFGGDTEIELDPGDRLGRMGRFQVPAPETNQPRAGGKRSESQHYGHSDAVDTVAARASGPSTGPTRLGGPKVKAPSGPGRPPASGRAVANAATMIHDEPAPGRVLAPSQPTLFQPDPRGAEPVDPLGKTGDISELLGKLSQPSEPGRNPISVYDTPPPPPPHDEPWREQEEMRRRMEAQPRAQPLPPQMVQPAAPEPMSAWVLALAFLVAAGVGMGLTVLFASQ